MGKIHALLVGVDGYPAEVAPALSGCGNDIAEARRLVADLAGERAVVTVLLDGAATVAAVEDAVVRELGKAGPGDTALLWFSGHGTQMPAAGADLLVEATGMNQAVLCVDGPLLDKRLGALLNTVAAGGAQVTAVLDCCHSGGGTRRQAGLRYAAPSPAWRVPAEGAAAREAVAEAPRGHVLMAASRLNQLSFEDWFDGRQYGVFTHALVGAARAAGPNATCRQLLAAAAGRVERAGRGQQPVLLPDAPGGPADQPFLGLLSRGSGPAGAHLLRYGPDGWEVDCGTVHGLREVTDGAEFTVDGTEAGGAGPAPGTPTGAAPDPAGPLGTGAGTPLAGPGGGGLTGAGPDGTTQPTTEPVGTGVGAGPSGPGGSGPTGARPNGAWPTGAGPGAAGQATAESGGAGAGAAGTVAGGLVLRARDVRMERTLVDPVGWVPDRGRVYPVVVSALALAPGRVRLEGPAGAVRELAEAVAPLPLLRMADGPGEAAVLDLRVRVAEGAAHVERHDGTPFTAPLPYRDGGDATRVARCLQHLTRWHEIRDLTPRPSPLDGLVRVEIAPWNAPGEVLRPDGGGEIVCPYTPGQTGPEAPWVSIRLHNRSPDRTLWCLLLNLSDDYACHSLLYPGHFIGPGRTGHALDGRPVQLALPPDRPASPGAQARDWLKLIVAERELNTLPFQLPAWDPRTIPSARILGPALGAAPGRWTTLTVPLRTLVPAGQAGQVTGPGG
ncbi:caspase family protein [Streptomyces flaveolus]|uniref:caspase family protein n=1 Tax=Streptomyces flaveolus TaxID=67297 RepID=UPI0033C94131